MQIRRFHLPTGCELQARGGMAGPRRPLTSDTRPSALPLTTNTPDDLAGTMPPLRAANSLI